MEQLESDILRKIRKNPIKTKKDLQALFGDLMKPLEKRLDQNSTHLFLGNTSASYSDQVAGLEAFARPLWGLGPFLAGGGKNPVIWEKYINGIKNGVDPNHENFWGYPEDFDQRTVETTSFGLTLALYGLQLFDELTKVEKDNLINWLQVANNVKTPDNNWNLFKVIVNTGFAKMGLDYNEHKNQEAFERLELYYIGNGWYSDGLTKQKDYYISFAIHFYCLIYAEMMQKEDSERAKMFKERAALFAKDFIYWFAADGSAFPFGRSMTYRFAQTAFWTALAFANVEAIPWGQMKGIVLRHIRWWMKRPIFTTDGLLTIGYGYSQLIMSEDYNAPGSPYWAFKSFLVLALDDNHPLWTAEEEELPPLQEVKTQKEPQMIICRDRYNQHVYALTSGQYAGFEPAHTAEKYSKFAYSNQFGFSVSKENYGLNHGAFDSILALSENDNHWRVRRTCEKVEMNEKYIYSLWYPWDDVAIETWLVPINLWHIRLHHIKNKRLLDSAEGGFAVPIKYLNENVQTQNEPFAKTSEGLSGIVDLFGERDFHIVRTSPNTNLLTPSVTGIPTLRKRLDVGSHLLGSAVLAHKNTTIFQEYWETPPTLVADEDYFRIIHENMDLNIKM